eukprot:gnl/MRDRNA2_/MRDRNA2_77970_c0_seq2.p1 gnl/MRDRNA2_/MRDRNA2_77970_c0~~gnl/MRDRNA2_/MRDRNA2_77970_c0_seq2.p1  ORF type:complete len:546 (+),score=94.45 gnl/MRDRNA2_/MRDRNA2_77970_c0_seq2:184-1821(+)
MDSATANALREIQRASTVPSSSSVDGGGAKAAAKKNMGATSTQDALLLKQIQSAMQIAALANPNAKAAHEQGIEASADSSSSTAPGTESEVQQAPKPKAEFKPCHLHAKKPKPNCKFCKQAAQSQAAVEAEQRAEEIKEVAAEMTGGLPDHLHRYLLANMSGPLELTNTTTFNFSPQLVKSILSSTYYMCLEKTKRTFNELIEEIHEHAEGVEVYIDGEFGTEPTKFICCLLRLFTLKPSAQTLNQLLYYPGTDDGAAYVRCIGCLVVRFGLPPSQLWPRLQDFILDEAEFTVMRDKRGSEATTIGMYVEALLREEKYGAAQIPLPRVPIPIQRFLEECLAPLPQYRRRTEANRQNLGNFRTEGTAVEACPQGTWKPGRMIELLDSVPSRLQVRIKFDDGDEVVPIGKVVLPGGPPEKAMENGRLRRDTSRSRSRSRSPLERDTSDWTWLKGKSDAELIQIPQSLHHSSTNAALRNFGQGRKTTLWLVMGKAITRKSGTFLSWPYVERWGRTSSALTKRRMKRLLGMQQPRSGDMMYRSMSVSRS